MSLEVVLILISTSIALSVLVMAFSFPVMVGTFDIWMFLAVKY